MTQSTKLMLLTGGALICVGVIIASIAVGVGKLRGDSGNKTNGSYEKKTETISENFKNLEVLETSDDVKICATDKSEATIEYYSDEYRDQKISVQGDTLKIEYEDKGGMQIHLGINIAGLLSSSEDQDIPVTIYLPDRDYEDITIKTASGDISSEDSVSCDEFKATTASGDTSLSSIYCENFEATAASGDIKVQDISATDGFKLGVSSGNIKVDNSTGKTFKSTSASGNINLGKCTFESTDVSTASGDVELSSLKTNTAKVNTASGDIDLDDFESANTEIESTSGEVEGTLKGKYSITTKTTSGDVEVKDNFSDGYPMTVKTTSGDIKLKAS